MSDSNNPFSAAEKRTSALPRATVVAWSVAAVSIATAIVLVGLWSQTNMTQQRELKTLRAELEKTGADLARALSVIQTNQDLFSTLTNQISDLEKQRDMAGQMARSLEDEMRQELESKDVKISKLQGKLTVTIVDRVMFDSGEAILKPDGAAVMEKIASLLAAHPDLKIHVVGHTDNVPIRSAAHSRFATNWELSVARALAAVHFLTEKAGVDPRRVGAVGYGEFRPIAENSTAEGRAKNRRIEVTILPNEIEAKEGETPNLSAATAEPVESAAADPVQ